MNAVLSSFLITWLKNTAVCVHLPKIHLYRTFDFWNFLMVNSKACHIDIKYRHLQFSLLVICEDRQKWRTVCDSTYFTLIMFQKLPVNDDTLKQYIKSVFIWIIYDTVTYLLLVSDNVSMHLMNNLPSLILQQIHVKSTVLAHRFAYKDCGCHVCWFQVETLWQSSVVRSTWSCIKSNRSVPCMRAMAAQ